jgi:hypothetical protein
MIENIIQILGVPILLMALLCFMRGFHQIVRRGYYWFGASVGCALSLAAGISITVAIAHPKHPSDAFVLLSIGVSGAIACLVPPLFPVRNRRRAVPAGSGGSGRNSLDVPGPVCAEPYPR